MTERPAREGAQSPPERVTDPPPRQPPPAEGEPLDAWPQSEKEAERKRDEPDRR